MGQKEHSRAPSYYLPIISRNRLVGRVCSSCHMVNSLKRCCVFRAADRHLLTVHGPIYEVRHSFHYCPQHRHRLFEWASSYCCSISGFADAEDETQEIVHRKQTLLAKLQTTPLTLIFQPSSDSHMLKIQAGTATLSIPPQLLRGHLKTHSRTLRLLQATTTCVSCRRKAASVHTQASLAEKL